MHKLALLLTLCVSTAALAQSPQDKAAAGSLFEEGKKLRDAGNLAEACPKFEGSYRLAPTLGRKLNLADCYRRMGRTASAWAEFREAAAQAARDKDSEREMFARQAVTELEKQLSKMTVKLSDGAALTGLEVKRDGVVLPNALLGSGVPVDPGSHVVEATAPGRTAWSSKVHVGEGASVTVEVPVLGQPTHYAEPPVTKPSLAVPAPAPAPADTPPSPGRNRRILALVVGGVGVAALGTGVFFGLRAKSKDDKAHDGHCNDQNVCDRQGYDLIKSAQSAALVSTITVGVGVAAIAGGVVLYLTAPKDPAAAETALQISPTVGAGSFGVSLAGGF